MWCKPECSRGTARTRHKHLVSLVSLQPQGYGQDRERAPSVLAAPQAKPLSLPSHLPHGTASQLTGPSCYLALLIVQ